VLSLADSLRAVLVPFIAALSVLLVTMLMVVVVQRGIREIAYRLYARRLRHCEPFVNAWVCAPADTAALDRLVQRCGGARRLAAADLLLRPLRSITGDLIERSRDALVRLGLRDLWLARLHDRRWWVRSEAAQALGLIAEPKAVPSLTQSLDDDHEEVRAAAIEALGRIGDESTLAVLVMQLQTPRHQRARVVSALRNFGPAASAALVRWSHEVSPDRQMVAAVLGQLGSSAGLGTLTGWSGDPDAALRVACYRAIGDIGLDERAYYFALRALGDPHPAVRAMAARALGRSGRADASPYLAAHLSDEWTVAAHSAAALKQLGEPGLQYLTESVRANGPGADLARQMLWELRA
jgi:HEAT repeat protein